MTSEEELKCKKIAMRFLKEIGLFAAWNIYIKTAPNYALSRATEKTWYKNIPSIDRIFGRLDFTNYLRVTNDLKLPESISRLFRQYVNTLYPTIKIRKEYGIGNKLEIDKKSHRISIKY